MKKDSVSIFNKITEIGDERIEFYNDDDDDDDNDEKRNKSIILVNDILKKYKPTHVSISFILKAIFSKDKVSLNESLLYSRLRFFMPEYSTEKTISSI